MIKTLPTCGLLLWAFASQAQAALPAVPAADTAGLGAVQRARRAYEASQGVACLYALPGQAPACVGGHRDGIIPILYGLVMDTKTLRRARRGEIKLGGCMELECESYYYCTRHGVRL